MGKTAEDYEDDYTEPELRARLKDEIQAGDRGGRPGQWSARKAQLLTQEYEKHGGGYRGEKSDDQRHLEQWTEEEWTTQDDGRAIRGDGTARYLPKAAWERLSEEERRATERAKREGAEEGDQYVANTDAAKRARKEASVLAGYEDASVDELTDRLDGLGPEELRDVRRHEEAHKDRRTAKRAIDDRIEAEEEERRARGDAAVERVLDGYDDLSVGDLADRLDEVGDEVGGDLDADALRAVERHEEAHEDRKTAKREIRGRIEAAGG